MVLARDILSVGVEIMVSELIAIVDRLLQLVQYRQNRMRTLFEKIVEPAFADMLLIHRDYIAAFEHLIAEVLKRESPVQIREEIERRRIEFEPVRERVAALAHELNNVVLGQELDNFVRAVQAYFPTGELVSSLLDQDEPALTMKKLSRDCPDARKHRLSERTPEAVSAEILRDIRDKGKTELRSDDATDRRDGEYRLHRMFGIDLGKPYTVAIRHLDGLATADWDEGDQYLRAIEGTVLNCRLKWAQLCEAYATLKVAAYRS